MLIVIIIIIVQSTVDCCLLTLVMRVKFSANIQHRKSALTVFSAILKKNF